MQPATRTPNWFDLRGTAITIGIALAVMAVPLIPGGAGWLQFDRLAIMDGQWWRMLTGHLTHWNLDHLFWDLLMFVVLGAMVERLSRPRFVLLCLVSAISISLTVQLGQAHLWTYRGLSGIDTALFVYLACDQLTQAWHHRRWGEGLLPAVLLAGFGGKLLYELATGSTLFVDSQAAGFIVVVAAHAVGASTGAVLGIAFAQLGYSLRPEAVSVTQVRKSPLHHKTRMTILDPLSKDVHSPGRMRPTSYGPERTRFGTAAQGFREDHLPVGPAGETAGLSRERAVPVQPGRTARVGHLATN